MDVMPASETKEAPGNEDDDEEELARLEKETETEDPVETVTQDPLGPMEDVGNDMNPIGWDGEWVTPENVNVQRRVAQAATRSRKPKSSVACCSTDFALQNVLLQMGLRLLSANGLMITSLRTWATKCTACYRTMRGTMPRKFCPTCGGMTLVKVAVFVRKDGSVRYRYPIKKITNLRGTVYPLPAPKGGRHAKNPVLREDVYMSKLPYRMQKEIRGGQSTQKKGDWTDWNAPTDFGARHGKSFDVSVGAPRRNMNAVQPFKQNKNKRNRRRK